MSAWTVELRLRPEARVSWTEETGRDGVRPRWAGPGPLERGQGVSRDCSSRARQVVVTGLGLGRKDSVELEKGVKEA